MGRAISYALKNWDPLTVFLDDARVPVDNDRAEGALRVAALGRKNFLFVGNGPVLSRLQMHTPLGTSERTVFRFVGMHLIAQHLRQLEGLEPQWSMDALDLLKQLRVVNRYMAERIRQATEEDAMVNGLIVLDAMSDSVEISLGRGLVKMRRMFEPYLTD